jgi:hypothetical protein
MLTIGDENTKFDLLSEIALWLLISTGAQIGRPSLRLPIRMIKSGRLERSDGLNGTPKALASSFSTFSAMYAPAIAKEFGSSNALAVAISISAKLLS